MYSIKHCGMQVTEEDYAALTQEERKRLLELVKSMMNRDRQTPEKELRERAYHTYWLNRVAAWVGAALKLKPTPGPLHPCAHPRKGIFNIT